MLRMNLEMKMEILHQRLSRNPQIKGSILLHENGLHISSNIPKELPESRRLSAALANIWRQLYKTNNLDEGNFQLKQFQFFMKAIPSKKVILALISDNTEGPELQMQLARYSQIFQRIL
jgi:predicted regulator of Ras-like GTPase activity (Roadblock/LC7/MglB family)